MKTRVSLRWKLILFSGSLAFAFALLLGTLVHLRGQRQLLQQLEKTLETKCDEVITVIENAGEHPSLDGFLQIETNYRYTPYTYYYQIGDEQGRLLVRSQNLGSLELPIPPDFRRGDVANLVRVETVSNPLSPRHERIRLRTERIELAIAGSTPATRVIQTAVSLGAFEAAVLASLRNAVLVAAAGLAVVLSLLWYATTRSLRPVAAMTRKASEISATNLRERLPVTGTADELDQLATVLNDMLGRLRASLKQMEHFSADAAHQLRTPLTRIRGELDLILRGELSAPMKVRLEKILEELERLSRLCARLLLLARLDQHAADASLLNEAIDIEELVSELLEQTAPLAQDHGINLRQGSIVPARVRGSRPLLVEALLNLLDNAIRYTPADGFVAVSVDASAGSVRISVEDSGPGVRAEERERIFQPFYRIQRNSGGQDQGSGLGLTIVKGIALAHGGRVELIAPPTCGSLFRLVLPVYVAA